MMWSLVSWCLFGQGPNLVDSLMMLRLLLEPVLVVAVVAVAMEVADAAAAELEHL